MQTIFILFFPSINRLKCFFFIPRITNDPLPPFHSLECEIWNTVFVANAFYIIQFTRSMKCRMEIILRNDDDLHKLKSLSMFFLNNFAIRFMQRKLHFSFSFSLIFFFAYRIRNFQWFLYNIPILAPITKIYTWYACYMQL